MRREKMILRREENELQENHLPYTVCSVLRGVMLCVFV